MWHSKHVPKRLTWWLSLPPLIQILQGNTRGHSGIWRHECRVLRQRETMATWNQSELWWRVPNIRWVPTFRCPEKVRLARRRRIFSVPVFIRSSPKNRSPHLRRGVFYFQWETKMTTPTRRWSRRPTRRSSPSRWESTFLRRVQKRTSMSKR